MSDDKEKKVKDLESPKKSWFWIRNSSGQASLSVTFLTISFLVTTAAYIFSMFEQVGSLKLRPFDAGATSVYFIPLLTLYFGRRWTDAKFLNEGEK